MQENKPTTHQGDLAKLPRALAPLVERPQWVVWRWTQQGNGRWQKPPYQALRSAAPCQHQGSRHMVRLRHRAGGGAGRARRRHLLRAHRSGSVCRDRSGSLPTSGHALDRRLGAEFPRRGSPHLCRSNPVGRGLPHLGFDRRRYRSGQQKIHTGDRRQADCRRAVSAHPESSHHYRLSARLHPGAHQYRSGVQLGDRLG